LALGYNGATPWNHTFCIAHPDANLPEGKMIGQTVSHYKILEKIGEGGMGVVYKAEDTRLKRPIALKFLSPELTRDKEAKTRFIHEAQAASALQHNNICTIHEIDETTDGQLFISMDCYDGQTLKEQIAIGPLSIDDTLNITIQITEGLSKAHEAGVVHRDIKSANIMVTNDGVIKILDFGLAKLVGQTKVTKTGTTVGTVAYMSPEQARGEEVDHRADIWSLGIILYELLSGKVPFEGDHEAAVIYSIMNEVPEPITALRTGVPVELDRIVTKALDKEPTRRYQRIEDLLVDLRNLRDKMVPGGNAVRTSGKFRRRLLAAVVALLVITAVLLVGIKIQVGREPPAIAAENKLAVMYFENMTDLEDKGRLGEIVTNLLITDLSDSRYVQVVSSQRLYDILKLLGHEGVKVIDRNLASQVAEKANAKWMLLGNILQVEPQVVLTAQLVDVNSGNAVASQKIRGEMGEEIFSLVDQMTVEIKNDLSLPAKALKEPDKPVANVTTNSPEAYRYYLEGNDYLAKYYDTEAYRSYRKALELDSTFAMVYLKLRQWAEPDEQKRMIAKAVELSYNVTEKERHYIRSEDAYFSGNYDKYFEELMKIVELYPEEKAALYRLGRYYHRNHQTEQAIDYYNKAIEIDPLYKVAYNQLAYIYNEIDNFEKSIWAINKYISIAPDEANPYDTRGDLYAHNGKIDQAIESYIKALEIKPDFRISSRKVGHMHLFKREYAKADSCYRRLSTSDDKNSRFWGRTCLAFVPLYQGKFVRALEVLDDGIAGDRVEQMEGWQKAHKHYLKARIYEEKNNLEAALEESKKMMGTILKWSPNSTYYWQDYHAYLLVKNGDVAKGEEILDTFRKNTEEQKFDAESEHNLYRYMVGKIELAKGNLAAAIANFEEITRINQYYDGGILLSSVCLEMGRLGEAVAGLEKRILRYDQERADDAINAAKVYYLLGRAYEKSGWNKKAIEQYEEFLEIWKDADPGIPEVEDAKERLAKLKNEE
jgi:tetratricopeptide (TPR) repeat protein/tRNA A-37 threonylcarbamoyl transferase component Bud32